MTSPLRTIDASAIPAIRRDPVDPEALAAVEPIVSDVRSRGEAALREHAERLGDLGPGDRLFLSPGDARLALAAIDPEDRALLERTADRIRGFALAQKEAIRPVEVGIPGGRAGHEIRAVDRAGCYAPGGRFPLPSSVLMTAVTATAAGVAEIWVASPRPGPHTLAAASVAGASGFLAAGGAQAIAALAFGAGPVPPSDVVAGPGNRFVTAAKHAVSSHVAIDMLAGPSELVVVADGSADPALVAADLLAQAEHDPGALPVLIALDARVVDAVNAEIASQLAGLPTAATAREALASGFAIVVPDVESAARSSDAIAPEHLELHLADAPSASRLFRHYGGLFVGSGSAEVLGDYGAGPNHVLPTGGSARRSAGLSVLHFLRLRTWIRIDDPKASSPLLADAARLAAIEGLSGHERSALRRLG